MSSVQPATAAAIEPILRDTLRARGAIPFATFMELCLYHPEHGYYTRGLGGGGGRDYVTSSGVHAAFGRLVARQAAEMWRLLGTPRRFRFVEFGPGEGRFAADFLGAADQDVPFAAALEYVLVETSPALRARQERRCAGLPRVAATPSWRSLEALLADPSSKTAAGCLFANEVLDAFPVHRIAGTPEGPREIHVELAGEDYRETPRAISTPALSDYLERNAIRPRPGQVVDVAPEAVRFVTRLGGLLERGWGLLVDYGEAAGDLFHPVRARGTLRAFHRHRLSHDVLAHPGEQDLTAHVDFTAVRRAATDTGWSVAGQVSQAHFLLALGALDDYEAQDLADRERLKDLVLPDRMGGAFQVLVLARGGVAEGVRGLSAPWRERAS
ncbi:MAG TPA: SAM-dependent methyltransferase [Candidatus Polarisedimenticolia bacterium]|nr:SAM-dependent methyltransferase [Candidatus Polarisedimenticolia bacterium]